MRLIALVFAAFYSLPSQAFLGLDVGPLLQLVSGQVRELERLSESIGLEKENLKLLRSVNEGIEKTVAQIDSINAILERSQGLDPTSARSLSDLNDLMDRISDVQSRVEEVMGLKVELANQAIEASALQGDTAYKMGQEMVLTGSSLTQESKTASVGRATQITAAASSAQMLSQGVELQMLSHVAELQALLLDFQKAQMEADLRSAWARRLQFQRELSRGSKKKEHRS